MSMPFDPEAYLRGRIEEKLGEGAPNFAIAILGSLANDNTRLDAFIAELAVEYPDWAITAFPDPNDLYLCFNPRS